MARIRYFKKAQQRYGTKPALDEDGKPRRSPVMSKRTGEQKQTKGGALVWRDITVRDLDRPLPMPKCDHCGKPIEVGKPYRLAQTRPNRYRHGDCPTWQPWDLSSAMWAQVARVVANAEEQLDGLGLFDSEDDVKAVLDEAASEARDLAEQRRESAQNIVDGFGHETEQSYELESHADNLESWADDLEVWQADESYPDEDDDEDEDDEALDSRRDDWRETTLDSARGLLQDTPEV